MRTSRTKIRRNRIIFLVILILLLVGIFYLISHFVLRSDKPTMGGNSSASQSNKTTESQNKSNENGDAKAHDKNLWKKPTGDYPDLEKVNDLKILVDTKNQKTFLYDGSERLTSFVVSTGILDGDSNTPLGDYVIENERGENFFAASFGEGANYWVSFKDHGIYLFHSVPTDENGDYIVSEAEKLGKPASHGCVRMSVPDAKWFYENIPTGTPVKII